MSSSWFVSCAKGLEGLVIKELATLGITDTRETIAGAGFQGDIEAAYRVCLWSRLANRVLLPLATYQVESSNDLYEGAYNIDWSNQFEVSSTIAVDFTGTGPGINHTRFGAQRVKDGIVDHFRDHIGQRPDVQIQQPDVRINARLNRGKMTLSLDFSGESLHRRGYRKLSTKAPLKETLAAAILIRAGWPDSEYSALVDPMCGSGTLLIEAGLISCDIAPGLARSHHGFLCWSGHRSDIWQPLCDEAIQRRIQGMNRVTPMIRGFDIDDSAVRATEINVEAAGLSSIISVAKLPVNELRNPLSEPGLRGLFITNPPYGERLGKHDELRVLYADLGRVLKEHFVGWRAAVFSANEQLCAGLGLRSDRHYKLFNGKLPTRLLLYDIFPEGKTANSSDKTDGAVGGAPTNTVQNLSEGATMLANRLRKNQRKLRNWLRSGGIECYRLYDADLPEYAVAIDYYGDAIHVQEYAPPADHNKIVAERRLKEVRDVISLVLKPPPGSLFFKQRHRLRGRQQYERNTEQNAEQNTEQGDNSIFTVQESGMKFEVNLSDYIDTGLFLDHRPMRQLLAQVCKGRKFLNLFCYTASATVFAACRGASESLSVDISNTYLNWAKRNFRLNEIDPAQHRLLRKDCLAWLKKGGDGACYDVIFLDPPTFSNSKKMNDVLDVQRDHGSLIRQAVNLLNNGGVLFFSTNLRRFKMAKDILDEFDVENITAQTIDKDFERRPNIHHCWEIRQGETS
jgi:23S rRNA (guanine2445-N2)-methyltransferase / 23S rRNA (guanine2069-N7)-methyltransferase